MREITHLVTLIILSCLFLCRAVWGQPYTVTPIDPLFTASSLAGPWIGGTYTEVESRRWLPARMGVDTGAIDHDAVGGWIGAVISTGEAAGVVDGPQPGRFSASYWDGVGGRFAVDTTPYTSAFSLNAEGVVCGRWQDTDGDGVVRAMRWWPGGSRDVLQMPGGVYSEGRAIDGLGRVWGRT